MKAAISMSVTLAILAIGPGTHEQKLLGPDDSYLTWTRVKAQRIGQSTRVEGRVGGLFVRIRSFNYRLRATWLTPDVIRATARLTQLAERLSSAETRTLVQEAEAAAEIVIMVEIDSNDGAGVIPLDWIALLGPRASKAGEPELVRGKSMPGLREVRALSGTFRRDYDYEVFWVVFPLFTQSGQPLFPPGITEAELVVRVRDVEGQVRWKVPDSARRPAR